MAFFPTGSGGLFGQGAFQIDPNATPEQLQRKRELLAAMMPQYGNARYVGQGLGHLAAGIMQGRQRRQLDKVESKQTAEGKSRIADLFQGLLGGGRATDGAPILGLTPYNPPDPNSPEGIAGDAMVALGKRSPYADAIASVESAGSGDYSALGPVTKSGDRAYGRYQVMGSNIGPWTEKYLGRRMTPEEFVASPEAQDAVFNGEFGGYVQKYGNPQDAASMWFSGRPMSEAGNASDGYNTVPQYVEKFSKAMGGQAMPAGGGMEIGALAEIAASPYADPGQKAVAQMLLEQQMGAMDPNNQLDLEYKRAQIDALKNPPKKDDRTPDMREYDRAVLDFISRGQPVPTFTEWMRGNKDAGGSELVRQREELAKLAGLTPGTPDYQQFMLTGNTVGRGANEYGLNPLFGTDEAGNVTVMQLGKDGTAIMTKLPEGVTPNLGIRKEEEARGSAVGKQAGEAAADLSGARITADRTLGLIDELYNDPYLDSMIGPVQGRLPNVSASAGRVQSRMDQLQGTAFLEAYNMLRGGGQITEVEGKKAESAMARLRTAQSEADYRAALLDFRDAVETGISKLEARAGTTAFKPQAGGDDLSAEERAYLGME